jgi:hypothetical protein
MPTVELESTIMLWYGIFKNEFSICKVRLKEKSQKHPEYGAVELQLLHFSVVTNTPESHIVLDELEVPEPTSIS